MMDPVELSNRFKYHKPTTLEVADCHDQIRDFCDKAAKQFNEVLPDGREKALVMTHLEEVMMWANAAIARNQNGKHRMD